MPATLQRDLETLRAQGYVMIESLLGAAALAEIKAALAPHLSRHVGRNDFEGRKTERVYALAAKGHPFADMALHPRVLALLDALLMPNYLLSASQAIHIHPGETAQPLHTDDSFYPLPRPRSAVSISTIWAIDPFTEENGATRIIPGSHAWGDELLQDSVGPDHFSPESGYRDVGQYAGRERRTDYELVTAAMPAGSVIVFAGTLWHGGGANRSAAPRLAISHQYCEPWARPQENYFLAVEPTIAAGLHPRLRAMLGYSIHPPFMGHVQGRHPEKYLPIVAKPALDPGVTK